MNPSIQNMTTEIKVGLTEAHGMVKEFSQFPGKGIRYSFLKPLKIEHRLFKSPIKGYLQEYNSEEHDLIEAILSPIITSNNWIYSIANFQEALAFNFLNIPIPRQLRLMYIKSLFSKKNFKKLIFWSHAGKATMLDYGRVEDSIILDKAAVVYPAVRKVPDSLIQYNNSDINLLFSGDFFRKGGVNVIDAFEKVQKKYGSIYLRLCCDEKLDFNTTNQPLKSEYLKKIKTNKHIQLGRVPRELLISEILPQTDIFISPTYYEAFGFAFLEAMAFGIPIISTNHFAIPEIVAHEKTGFLVDIDQFDTETMFKGYTVNKIPEKFRQHITERVYEYLCQLIESADLRKNMGQTGIRIARDKFSFETRNKIMGQIYRSASIQL